MIASNTGYVSIYDLFGDSETRTYAELLAAGLEFDMPEITVSILIQHAEENGFISEIENGYQINLLSY